MTDKVQKIREEVEKLHGNPYYMMAVKDVLEILDMQEEPVSEDFEDALAREWHGYNDRGAATVDALEDNTQELAFAKGFYRGAKWQKEHLWKHADGDDLPEIDREVVALTQPYTNDERLRVVFAHRPNKYTKVWNSDLGEEQVVEIERHGKGGWNIPDIVYWLDVELPKEIEL